MSNTPTVSPTDRLLSALSASLARPATLTFIILLLALGTLLIASNGIDPLSTVRAVVSPTVNGDGVQPFGFSAYTSYQSDDKVIKVDMPVTWTPLIQADQSGTVYLLSPGGQQNASGVAVLFQVFPRATITRNLTSITAQSSLRDVATALLTSQGQSAVNLQDVHLGALNGISFRQINTPSATQPVATQVETWFVTLDPTRILVVQGSAPSAEWDTQMTPVFQHIVNSLSVNTAVLALTPTATFAPTRLPSTATPATQ